MASLRQLAFTALLAAALAACSGPGAGTASAAAPAAPGQQELVVRQGDFERRVLITGSLEASRAVALTVPRNPSWQVDLRWLAEDGSTVRAGDPVIELDDSAFASELENQETALAERAAELESRAAELALLTGEKEFEVARRRSEVERAALEAELPEGIVPRQELETRRLALARARLELETALADLVAHREGSAAELEIQRIELRKVRREMEASLAAIRELRILAPVDGMFLVGVHPWNDRKLQVGDTVWVGLAAATIPDLSSLVVEARLPDVDDGSVAPGMRAVTTLDAYPGASYAGTVREVAPVAQDEGSESLRRSFRTVIELAEVDRARMIPGMSARVEVISERREDVLLVPRQALAVDPQGQVRLNLAEGGTTAVTLGPCNDLECVVVDGVGPGTRVAPPGPPGVPSGEALP